LFFAVCFSANMQICHINMPQMPHSRGTIRIWSIRLQYYGNS
jgi:hypothetical protein